WAKAGNTREQFDELLKTAEDGVPAGRPSSSFRGWPLKRASVQMHMNQQVSAKLKRAAGRATAHSKRARTPQVRVCTPSCPLCFAPKSLIYLDLHARTLQKAPRGRAGERK